MTGHPDVDRGASGPRGKWTAGKARPYGQENRATLLSAQTRKVFPAALAVDEATWERGRGRALSIGLIALPYDEHTNPVFAAPARHMIAEVLADHKADHEHTP